MICDQKNQLDKQKNWLIIGWIFSTYFLLEITSGLSGDRKSIGTLATIIFCLFLWIGMAKNNPGRFKGWLEMFYCDNKPIINIADNTMQHDRIKHIEVDRHFIK